MTRAHAGGVRRRRVAGVAAAGLALGLAALPGPGAPGAAEPSVAPVVDRRPSVDPTPGSGPTSPLGPAPSPDPAARPARKPAVVTIGWVGDTTPGSEYGLPPRRGRALFAGMRKVLSAPDLMIANLEGTYSTGGASKCDGSDNPDCFTFRAPPAYAGALAWAGVDLVNLANNHAHDFLGPGLEQTRAALTRHRIAFTGLPGQVTVVRAGTLRVAVVGFSPYWWNASLADLPTAAALVRRAGRRADLVVVTFHGGAEGSDQLHTPRGVEYDYGEYRGELRVFARTVVDAGADLVVGSGPHVIRGLERYRGRLIAYSLGNFGGWGNFRLEGVLSLSGLLTVSLDADGRLHGGRWRSLLLRPPGVPTLDPQHRSARLVQALSAADFARPWSLDDRGRLAVRRGIRR